MTHDEINCTQKANISEIKTEIKHINSGLKEIKDALLGREGLLAEHNKLENSVIKMQTTIETKEKQSKLWFGSSGVLGVAAIIISILDKINWR